MKITRSKKNGEKYTYSTVKLETATNLIRHEIKSQPVSNLRYALSHTSPDCIAPEVNKVPLLIFGCAKSHHNPFEYNGLITLEVNRLIGIEEAKEVRDRVSVMPQTLVTFIGSSGKSVKIIVPFRLLDNSLPQTYEATALFHAESYKKAVALYQPQLQRDITKKKPSPEQTVRLSYDPDLYFNPDAIPIYIEQPTHLPGEETFEEKQQTIDDPLQRMLPGYDRYNRIFTLFNFAYGDALSHLKSIGKENDRQTFLIHLAGRCFESGIPEEDAVWWLLYSPEWHTYETEVRYTFHNIYTTKRLFGRKPFVPKPMILVAQLEEFLIRRYRLRHNEITNMVEYYEPDSLNFNFKPVTDKIKNSMVINAQLEGIGIWDKDIERYLSSTRIPEYNPVEDYLAHLPSWDGKDRIEALADRISCDNPDVWRRRFHRWFLSMVAHWNGMDKEHANSQVPLLIGGQGTQKSTFCAQLLPPQFKIYYCEKIDFSEKKTSALALSRFLLINLDEFDSISPSHQGFLKHIIQETYVQERPPHGKHINRLRRYATFIATCNKTNLLSDPTGSRRFIGVQIRGVVNNERINYDQLYSQAMAELEAGTRYWFTYEEGKQLTEDNLKFSTVSLEEDFFNINFRRPEKDEKGEWLLLAEILERIKQYHKGYKYTQKKSDKLREVLNNTIENKRGNRGMMFHVFDIRAADNL